MNKIRRPLTWAFVAVVSVLVDVHAAHAQAFFAPSLGVTLGNESGEGHADFGAAIGWVDRRAPLGVELDVVYAPSFFGGAGIYGANSVTTVMANVILAGGAPGRSGFGRRGGSVRPFVSGGAGVMHEVVTTLVPGERVANNDLGVNLGFGIMAAPRRSVGVRGEVRYFRNLVNNATATDIDFGAFHFWRASIGLLLGF